MICLPGKQARKHFFLSIKVTFTLLQTKCHKQSLSSKTKKIKIANNSVNLKSPKVQGHNVKVHIPVRIIRIDAILIPFIHTYIHRNALSWSLFFKLKISFGLDYCNAFASFSLACLFVFVVLRGPQGKCAVCTVPLFLYTTTAAESQTSYFS